MENTEARQQLRLSSRAIAVSGLLLCVLFFSPFVSCGNQTLSGMQAFQGSLPTEYTGPRDGILLIILPIVGLVSLIVGLAAMGRVDRQEHLGALRGFGLIGLLSSLFAACPLGVLLYDVNQSTGAIRLEWGFWGSLFAMLALVAGSFGLLKVPPAGQRERTAPPTS